MASITLTKPEKWAWDAGSIEVPTDADNLLLCEPFWAVDDWPLTDNTTHSDLTGKTLTFRGSTASFQWQDDANVGPALVRTDNLSNFHGLICSNAALDTDTHSHVFVVKRIGTSEGAWFGSGDQSVSATAGYSLNFSATGEIRLWSHFSNAAVATSTGTVADGEWHCIGIVMDEPGGTIKFFIDGEAAGSASITDRADTQRRSLFQYNGDTGVTAIKTIGFALMVEWSDVKSDAFMEAITADPYRLLRRASGGGEVEGTGTSTIGDFTSEGEGDAGTPSVEGSGSSTIGDFVSEGEGEAVSAGTITTEPLKNNTGTVWANETGATVYIYDPDTGELVVSLTEQTTDASGVMTITDPLIVGGTEYRVVIVLSSGAEGMDRITAT